MSSTKSFEKMTAGFLLTYQNLLRYFTPEIMHFQALKNKSFNQYINPSIKIKTPQNDCTANPFPVMKTGFSL